MHLPVLKFLPHVVELISLLSPLKSYYCYLSASQISYFLTSFLYLTLSPSLSPIHLSSTVYLLLLFFFFISSSSSSSSSSYLLLLPFLLLIIIIIIIEIIYFFFVFFISSFSSRVANYLRFLALNGIAVFVQTVKQPEKQRPDTDLV